MGKRIKLRRQRRPHGCRCLEFTEGVLSEQLGAPVDLSVGLIHDEGTDNWRVVVPVRFTYQKLRNGKPFGRRKHAMVEALFCPLCGRKL